MAAMEFVMKFELEVELVEIFGVEKFVDLGLGSGLKFVVMAQFANFAVAFEVEFELEPESQVVDLEMGFVDFEIEFEG